MLISRLLDLNILQEYIEYCEKEGILIWKKRPSNRVMIGNHIGTYQQLGYLTFSLCNKQMLVHRVIWKMHTWEEPAFEIDHKDTNTSNNKFSNLRLANRHTNLANSNISSANTSGYKGVGFSYGMNKWRARIMVNYKDIIIGYFNTKEEAYKARKNYAIKLYGEYAREG